MLWLLQGMPKFNNVKKLQTACFVSGLKVWVHGMFADVVSLDRCHPRAGLVCGSGWKEQSPENLLEAPPLPVSREGAPSRGWEVSGDPEAVRSGCPGAQWARVWGSHPVTPARSLVLTGGVALMPFTVDEGHVALVSKSGTQRLGILRG